MSLLRYWSVNHGPTTWVKATSAHDTAAVIVAYDLDNEEDPAEWHIVEVDPTTELTVDMDEGGRPATGPIGVLFADDHRGPLCSTEY